MSEVDDLIDHFPWHYTEYGVLCACGDAMDSEERCRTLRAAAEDCKRRKWPEQHRDDCAWCAYIRYLNPVGGVV